MSIFGDSLRGLLNWLRPVLPDLGTVCLGIAAILVARAVPSSSLRDFDVVLIVIGVGFAFVGLVLRRFGQP